MTPAELTAWRSRLGLTAKAAAEALGLSINGYAAYERGYVEMTALGCNGKAQRPIPKHVEYATAYLENQQKAVQTAPPSIPTSSAQTA